MSLIYNIHPSWNEFFTEDIIKKLDIIEEEIGDNIFPIKENVLRFASTDFNNIKCIIMGMDPYPSQFELNGKIVPEATGRSFEVESIRGKSWSSKFKQSSLRNMLKAIYFNETNKKLSLDEIRSLIEDGSFEILPPGKWFDDLESQGVLFLNATLSVIPGKPDSHRKIWTDFMNELIIFIDKKNPKWLLWGDKAQTRALPLIKEENAFCAVHPRIASFVDENPFKNVPEINWTGINH